MQVRQRHFGGGDEIEALAGAEQVLLELGKLPGAEERLGIDEKRRVHLFVSVRARLEVEHERSERAGEASARAGQNGEPRAREPGAALEVQNAERGTQVPVRRGFEVEAARLSPRALDPVRGLVGSAGDRLLRRVGNPLLGGRQLFLDALRLRLQIADLVLERLHLGERVRIGPAAHRRQLVAAAALLLETRHRGATPRVQLHEPFEARAGEPLRHLGEQARGVLAQELAW